jgi:hypothetical protein
LIWHSEAAKEPRTGRKARPVYGLSGRQERPQVFWVNYPQRASGVNLRLVCIFRAFYRAGKSGYIRHDNIYQIDDFLHVILLKIRTFP